MAFNFTRATLTFGKLLSEDAGLGELAHQGSGKNLNLPVVLYAIPGSNASDAVYNTPAGLTPRIHVAISAIRRKPGQGNFQIHVNDALLNTPAACSDNQSSAMLHTRMSANDGTHSSAVFGADLSWDCRRGGKLVIAPGQRSVESVSPPQKTHGQRVSG